jgi:hypothetical protein
MSRSIALNGLADISILDFNDDKDNILKTEVIADDDFQFDVPGSGEADFSMNNMQTDLRRQAI